MNQCKEKKNEARLFGIVISLILSITMCILISSNVYAASKRQMPACSFDGNTYYLYNIPENSSVAVNGSIVSNYASGIMDLGPYIRNSQYYTITIIANGYGDFQPSDPQIIQAQKPVTPQAVFDGPSCHLYPVATGMVYSIDGGHSWINVRNGETGVNLSYDQINIAASYGYICVKQTMPIESDIEYVVMGRMSQPSGVSGSYNKIVGVSPEMEYRYDGYDSWLPITGYEVTGLNPGRYHVRKRGQSHYAASNSVEVYVMGTQTSGNPGTIIQVPGTGLVQEPTPSAIFNGYNMTLSGVAGCRISFDAGKSFTDTQLSDVYTVKKKNVNVYAGIQIYKPGNRITTSDSARQVIAISMQSAPIGITAASATSTTLGMIQNVDDTMQVRCKENPNWVDIDKGQTSLLVSAGTYYVRRHGYGNTLPSDSLTVIIQKK